MPGVMDNIVGWPSLVWFVIVRRSVNSGTPHAYETAQYFRRDRIFAISAKRSYWIIDPYRVSSSDFAGSRHSTRILSGVKSG